MSRVTSLVRATLAIVLAGLVIAPPARAQRTAAVQAPMRALVQPPTDPLPVSSLAVSIDGSWRIWWRSSSTQTRWTGPDSTLNALLRWKTVRDGIEYGEVVLAGRGEAWRTRIIAVRIDPSRVELALETGFGSASGAAWTIDRAPEDAVFAVNGGQFVSTMPWGWVQLEGRQVLAPGAGPLVSTVGVDARGAVHWSHAAADDTMRRAMRWGFQSYPTLLAAGEVPAPLRAAGLGVDVAHRDARLALGLASDGRLLIAMTRFDALGGRLGFIPFGLTTPEMAAVMGALGARDAVLLDGGISAQMMLRDSSGVRRAWSGMRAVPLAVVARRRPGGPRD